MQTETEHWRRHQAEAEAANDSRVEAGAEAARAQQRVDERARGAFALRASHVHHRERVDLRGLRARGSVRCSLLFTNVRVHMSNVVFNWSGEWSAE